jgi:hypothetical protein
MERGYRYSPVFQGMGFGRPRLVPAVQGERPLAKLTAAHITHQDNLTSLNPEVAPPVGRRAIAAA